MEEIVVGTGRLILRMLTWFFIETLIGTFLYWYGRLTLKLLSFGKYPPASEQAEGRCILAGFVSLALTLALIVSITSM